MLRDTLVAVHIVSGVAGLIAGIPAFGVVRTTDSRPWVPPAYLSFLVVLLASMVALILVDWSELDPAARAVFSALGVLGAVMVFRMNRAWQIARERPEGWRDRYLSGLYFTYISLWEGFVILPALNLSYPYVAVPVVAISILVIGHLLLRRYRLRLSLD